MDKYPMRNSFLNIFIFDKPPMCGRMVDWGTRDLRRDVRFYCLLSSGPRLEGHGTHNAPLFFQLE